MVDFFYTPETKNLYPHSNITIDINVNDDDVCLTELFAYFVEFTRMIGYQPGSWSNILKELKDILEDASNDYDIYSWAIDTIGGN